MMQHRLTAVVFLALAGLSVPAYAVDPALPVSASQPPLLPMNANTNTVPVPVTDDSSLGRPELLGALAIGVYALYKSRSRRIV